MEQRPVCRLLWLLAIFFLCCHGNIAAEKGRNPRGDDLTPHDVMVVVQQQASAMQEQSAEIQALQAKLTQQSSCMDTLQRQSADIQTLRAKVTQQSAYIETLQQQSSDLQDLRHNMTQQSAYINILQQQTADLHTLGAELTQHSEDIKILQSQSWDIHGLEAKVSAVEREAAMREFRLQRLSEKVAFTAYFTRGGAMDIGQSAPIRYSHVAFNEGNGYDSNTGMFTAPVSGIYLFLVHIKSVYQNNNEVNVDLVRSHTVLGTMSVMSRDLSSDKSSMSVTAHVQQGESVFTRHSRYDTILDQWNDTSFSGMLLYAD